MADYIRCPKLLQRPQSCLSSQKETSCSRDVILLPAYAIPTNRRVHKRLLRLKIKVSSSRHIVLDKFQQAFKAFLLRTIWLDEENVPRTRDATYPPRLLRSSFSNVLMG
ncbi:hypothetical protein TNCV_2823781 [Trichonephila clavipes]|nr:hypothetical protein TNCV_2823781 [Trichonephila clavipes]